MPYMLAPGARLVVGPHGKLEESMGLGACAACSRGRALGDVGSATSALVTIAGLGGLFWIASKVLGRRGRGR